MRVLILILIVMTFSSAFALDIVIDGEKDAFYESLTGPDDGWIWVPSESNTDIGLPDDDYDLSFNFWCAWDEEFFYCYQEVNDELVTCPNATTYYNDCMELKFDPNPMDGDPAGMNVVVSARMTALDSADVPEDVWSGINNIALDGNAESTTVWTEEYYARRLTDEGYAVECKIPWNDIYHSASGRGPIVAEVGGFFGMAVMNHDNDENASMTREDGVAWATVPLNNVWQDVTLHGTVTFLEGNKLKLEAMNDITGDFNDFDYSPPGTGVAASGAQQPIEFSLSPNYPNPFNPTTTIEFSLPAQSNVTLKVFDALGHQVAELVNGPLPAGQHSVLFDGSQLASGIYFYQLQNNSQMLIQKMMLVK